MLTQNTLRTPEDKQMISNLRLLHSSLFTRASISEIPSNDSTTWVKQVLLLDVLSFYEHYEREFEKAI